MNFFLSAVARIDPSIRGLSSVPISKTLIEKIISFLRLQPGWHYGDGCPSPPTVVQSALRWSSYLRGLGLNDLDAFPGDSGEILISAIHGDHSVDVILEIDGTVSVAYDRSGAQQTYIPRALENEAHGHVATLMRKIWSLSAGYIAIGSTHEKTVSPAWPLETRGTMGVYPCQSATVYVASGTHQVARSVNMPKQGTWNVAAVS